MAFSPDGNMVMTATHRRIVLSDLEGTVLAIDATIRSPERPDFHRDQGYSSAASVEGATGIEFRKLVIDGSDAPQDARTNAELIRDVQQRFGIFDE